LLCLPLLLAGLPQNSYAFDFADLWLRADQQGQRLLEAQQPAQAAQHFKHRQWQGVALYQAGDYAAAAERFAAGESAADHYNRGNALARSNELEAALEAYSQALELQPELTQAQTNKALIEELLRERQQQAAEPDAAQESANQADSPSPAPPGGQRDGEPQATPPPAGGAEPPQPTEQQPPPGEEPGAPPPDAPDEGDGEQQFAATDPATNGERRQALEQWLRQIPDDPGELLRRKFWLEQQRQEHIQ
jgi:Ca-activated chloride channel family protein